MTTKNSGTPGPSPLAISVAGAISLAVAMGIGRFAFTPMLPLMMQAGRIDVRTAGWVAAANYLGYLLGAMTAARMPLPAKWLAALALVATAAFTAAMSVAGPPLLWMALRLGAGACSAWAFVGTSVWCLGALARLRRPSWSGAVYSGVGAGIAAAGLYCVVAAATGVSDSELWVQLGLVALALTAPVLAVLRRLPAHCASPAGAEAATGPTAGTRGLVVCYGVLGFGYILPATFLPVLGRSMFADGGLFGMAWPVFGLTAAASTLVAGWLASRASRLRVWAASHALMAIGVLLPGVWPSAPAVILSALLVGGTFMVVTMAGIQEIRARASGDPTRLVGRMTAAFALGQIAGPVCSSLLLHVPAFAHSGLGIALQVAAVGLMLSAAWLWRQTCLPVPGHRPLETHRDTARTSRH